MVNIAIFASGNGSNFENIIHAIENGNLKGKAICRLLVVDKAHAYACERAQRLAVPYIFVDPKAYPSKEAYETEIQRHLVAHGVQLIVLAGYMRFIGKVLLEAYPRAIINLHPAYLPAFPGAHSIRDAYEAKASFTGVTVHYVDEGVDTGEIIHQEKLNIDKTWSLETLEAHVHALEYRMFPEVIEIVVGRLESEEA